MAETLLSRPTQGFEIFRDYEDSKFIYRDQLRALICYLIGNVNEYYSPNRSYYQDWLHESNNLQIVIRWREEEGYEGKGKYGERICYSVDKENGELIDLTKKGFKNHTKTCQSCNRLEAIRLRYDQKIFSLSKKSIVLNFVLNIYRISFTHGKCISKYISFLNVNFIIKTTI